MYPVVYYTKKPAKSLYRKYKTQKYTYIDHIFLMYGRLCMALHINNIKILLIDLLYLY